MSRLNGVISANKLLYPPPTNHSSNQVEPPMDTPPNLNSEEISPSTIFGDTVPKPSSMSGSRIQMPAPNATLPHHASSSDTKKTKKTNTVRHVKINVNTSPPLYSLLMDSSAQKQKPPHNVSLPIWPKNGTDHTQQYATSSEPDSELHSQDQQAVVFVRIEIPSHDQNLSPGTRDLAFIYSTNTQQTPTTNTFIEIIHQNHSKISHQKTTKTENHKHYTEKVTKSNHSTPSVLNR